MMNLHSTDHWSQQLNWGRFWEQIMNRRTLLSAIIGCFTFLFVKPAYAKQKPKVIKFSGVNFVENIEELFNDVPKVFVGLEEKLCHDIPNKQDCLPVTKQEVIAWLPEDRAIFFIDDNDTVNLAYGFIKLIKLNYTLNSNWFILKPFKTENTIYKKINPLDKSLSLHLS